MTVQTPILDGPLEESEEERMNNGALGARPEVSMVNLGYLGGRMGQKAQKGSHEFLNCSIMLHMHLEALQYFEMLGMMMKHTPTD